MVNNSTNINKTNNYQNLSSENKENSVINLILLYNNHSKWIRVRVMVFNATFNNISVISWRSVLLVEETGVPGENHRPVASH